MVDTTGATSVGAASPDTFSAALRRALEDSRFRTQKALADATVLEGASASATQMSNWLRGKSAPSLQWIRAMEQALGCSLPVPDVKAPAGWDVYISAPSACLHDGTRRTHHNQVAQVARALRDHGLTYFWPQETVTNPEKDFDRRLHVDTAVEENFTEALAARHMLYLQFAETKGPSGALIQLGMAIGMRTPLTLVVAESVPKPRMFGSLCGVTGKFKALGDVRYVPVHDHAHAVQHIENAGPVWFSSKAR